MALINAHCYYCAQQAAITDGDNYPKVTKLYEKLFEQVTNQSIFFTKAQATQAPFTKAVL